MKIDGNDPILKNYYPENKADSQKSTETEFDAILKESVAKSEKDVTEIRRTTFINPLNDIQMSPAVAIDKQFALDRVENLIGLLDQYRLKLADPGATLKNIDPIIREIDQESQNLAPVLDAWPEGEELKNITNQALVTASLEVAKFYRGDYI